jgi:hypothetical protein
MKPIVNKNKKKIIDKIPSIFNALKHITHGNKNNSSKSNIINKIEIK